MERIYSFKGWVKAIIDNENAEVLCQLEENGVGNIGKKTLVEMAKAQFEHWKEFCQLPDTESRIAVHVCVYGNDILPNGLLCRKEHECVYRDFVKIESIGTSLKLSRTGRILTYKIKRHETDYLVERGQVG